MRNPDSARLPGARRINVCGRTTREILLGDSRSKNDKRPQCPELANALAYMSGHLAERIHLRDLSRAAGVCPRTLGYLFLRTYGTTPMAYLKRQRLEQAYKLLAHADSLHTSVAEIARQCGFTHMGQFSLDYKAAMGELPSDTLNHRQKPAKPRGTLAHRPSQQD